jgi:hypothetical protein
MIFFDRPGCAANVITRVLVDHGYSAWPIDPPEQAGHVVLGLRDEPLADDGVRFALELRSRMSFRLLARSRHVDRAELNIDDITQSEAEGMVTDVVTSAAFRHIALGIADDIATRYSIDRPDLSGCTPAP